jgi:hypothetical protein
MVMTTKQQLATAFLAVLIVASVMSMPRAVDVPRTPPAVQASGKIAATSTVPVELNSEQVKDLTYN